MRHVMNQKVISDDKNSLLRSAANKGAAETLIKNLIRFWLEKVLNSITIRWSLQFRLARNQNRIKMNGARSNVAIRSENFKLNKNRAP